MIYEPLNSSLPRFKIGTVVIVLKTVFIARLNIFFYIASFSLRFLSLFSCLLLLLSILFLMLPLFFVQYHLFRNLIESVLREHACLLCGVVLDPCRVDVLAFFGDRIVFSVGCSCSSSVHVLISEKVDLSAPRFHRALRSSGAAMTMNEFLSLRASITQLQSGFSDLF